MKFLEIPIIILNNIDLIYTFVLLFARYAGFFFVVPGLGGQVGARLKLPAIMLMAIVSVRGSQSAVFSGDYALIIADIVFEIALGAAIGFIPYMIVSGLQLAAQVASNMMGLNAANIIDPSSGAQVGTLSRILEDLAIVIFLLIGGHYVLIEAISGLDGQIHPGIFRLDEPVVEFLIQRTSYIFESGVVLGIPVVVALLLTQFVLGIISKAVPTVNIFIISFPLTIGIGCILVSLSIPEIILIMQKEFNSLEKYISIIVQNCI